MHAVDVVIPETNIIMFFVIYKSIAFDVVGHCFMLENGGEVRHIYCIEIKTLIPIAFIFNSDNMLHLSNTIVA